VLVPVEGGPESRAQMEEPPAWTILGLHRLRGPLVLLSWRNRFIIAGSILVFAAGGLLYYLSTPKEYSASIELLLGVNSSAETAGDLMTNTSSVDSESSVATQLQLLRSAHVAQLVVNSEKLTQNDVPTFDPEHPWAKAITNVVEGIRSALRRNPNGDASGEIQKPVWQILREDVRVDRIERSYVATITVSATDPMLAYRVARSYGGAFLQDQITSNFDSLSQTITWLSDHPEAKGGPSQDWVASLAAIASTQQNLLVRPTARVVSDATVPLVPAQPRLLKTMTGWLAAGLFVAALLVLVREVRDGSYRSGAQLEYDLGLPFWGYVPSLRRQRKASKRSAVAWNPHTVFRRAEALYHGAGSPVNLGVVSIGSKSSTSDVAQALVDYLRSRDIPSELRTARDAHKSAGQTAVRSLPATGDQSEFVVWDLGDVQLDAAPATGDAPNLFIILVDWGRSSRSLVRHVMADYPELLKNGVGILLTDTNFSLLASYDPVSAEASKASAA
jgi:capsular polysaccharide biosynthesis protein